MPFSFKHFFQSAKADGGDPSLLQPSHWNAEHVITVPASSLVGNSTGVDASAEAVSVGSGLSLAGSALSVAPFADAIIGMAVSVLYPNTRVPTNTATVTWDVSVANQLKAAIPDNAVTLALLDHGAQGDLLYYAAAGAPTRLGAGTAGKVLTTGGAGANPSWGYLAGPPHAVLQDQKASGTHAGGATSGAWRDRVVNTELYDPMGIVTISDSAASLVAGTYVVEWSAPAVLCNQHQTRLWNDTDSSVLEYGTSEYSTDGAIVQSSSKGIARFTLAGTKIIKVQHHVQTTQAINGFGTAAGFSTEVYAEMKIWRVS